MNRLLIFFFSIVFIGCCNEKKVLNNGLTKQATKITEYTIKSINDSLNNKIQDTLVITELKYNENDQIIKRFQQNLFAEGTMEIDFVYNKSKKIEREIVKMSTDSLPLIVNYYYNDSLLNQTKSFFENDSEIFEQIESHYYGKNNKIEKKILSQVFVDKESTDTITNSETISFFNKNEFTEKTETINHKDLKRNTKTEFKYDCGTLIKTLDYNYQDSLISTTVYKYQLDKFDNWIKKEFFENDKLNYIKTREIEYK
ncbi:hypothetical protein [Polaribacter sp. Asnod1-A03]|uniref:hypothetical protein n=1 Tax=Polaribacter sp. Asnod1-A03 TaxID=3160581 RepID=UPI00386D4509